MKEVAGVTMTDGCLGLMIAAAEIPAQIQLLLFGVYSSKQNPSSLRSKETLKVV